MGPKATPLGRAMAEHTLGQTLSQLLAVSLLGVGIPDPRNPTSGTSKPGPPTV